MLITHTRSSSPCRPQGTASTYVNPTLTAGAGAGAVREYFIAALEDVWDYAPAGMESCGAKPAEPGDTAKGFLVASSSGLGQRHIKAQYVEFTDATFTKRKARLQPCFVTYSN